MIGEEKLKWKVNGGIGEKKNENLMRGERDPSSLRQTWHVWRFKRGPCGCCWAVSGSVIIIIIIIIITSGHLWGKNTPFCVVKNVMLWRCSFQQKQTPAPHFSYFFLFWVLLSASSLLLLQTLILSAKHCIENYFEM